MELIVNGQPKSFPTALTLHDLMQWCQATGLHIAVALNGTVISRQRLAETPLKEGDHIEIVRAVGGG